MYIVTNRQVDENCVGFDKFLDTPNHEGPHELRLVEAVKAGGSWRIRILDDELTIAEKEELKLPTDEKAYASRLVAHRVFHRLRREKKNLLFFVHGFNNDVKSVVERAERLAQRYDLEVVAFSWPANGGGIKGVADYKSDKRDARASTGALDRTLEKFRAYLDDFRADQIEKILRVADQKFGLNSKAGLNAEARDELIATRLAQDCPFTVNVMLHSMGNYLLKKLLQSSINHARKLLFDNVVMVAADANNLDHRTWVDLIQCRSRVYITINEDDAALRAARVKGGQEQLARLGHYTYNLESRQSVYIDFTDARWVKRSHAYFEGTALRNTRVEEFFKLALNGQRAEGGLPFDAARNLHRVR